MYRSVLTTLGRFNVTRENNSAGPSGSYGLRQISSTPTALKNGTMPLSILVSTRK